MILWCTIYMNTQFSVEIENHDITPPVQWPLKYDGVCRYLVCPCCGKRRRHLDVDTDGTPKCNWCLGFRDESQQLGEERRHRRQIARLIARLGGTEVETIVRMTIPPERPRGMHKATYIRLCERIDEHDEALHQLWLTRLAAVMKTP